MGNLICGYVFEYILLQILRVCSAKRNFLIPPWAVLKSGWQVITWNLIFRSLWTQKRGSVFAFQVLHITLNTFNSFNSTCNILFIIGTKCVVKMKQNVTNNRITNFIMIKLILPGKTRYKNNNENHLQHRSQRNLHWTGVWYRHW